MLGKIFLFLLKLIGKIAFAFFLISILSVALFKFVNPPVTSVMALDFLESLFEGKKAQIVKEWKSYDEISPAVFQAVIAAEDARFLRHDGIDWKAVEEARKYNERHKGKKLRGASTISMQTAKNVFLCHSRSYVRKAFEAYFTVLIEAVWGKKRILEVYVNIVEVGDGIYGFPAAGKRFFNREADKINRNQAALIAAVLPNPKRWNPARPTNYIQRRRSTILARMTPVRFKK